MSRLCRETAIHSLAWLVIANIVGVLLAALLLFPNAGALISPLTYGRWIPVHLNANLYGWCALPLVGLLFKLFAGADGDGLPAISLRVWSAVLAVACVSWLGGISSGKLFMEWAGPSRMLFPAGLAFLWLVLVTGFVRQLSECSQRAWALSAKTLLLLLLAAVPPLMYWAASPALYPPINPDSGGATGGSLLGSTLAVIAIIMVAPLIVGLRPRRASVIFATFAVLVLHTAGFALLDHGNRSHHERAQIVGLFSLVIWWPLLVIHLKQFTWPATGRRWLLALCSWGATLLATALFTFLPGVLESWKFTNALVGHSHIAMAGMLTSFNMIVLSMLSPGPALDRPRPFWLWQAGCVAHVSALLCAGTMEAASPALLFRGAAVIDALYAVRLAGGVAMTAASVEWLWTTCRGAK